MRRRSLHPGGNECDLSNPYEEFYIRSPRLQAKIDAERIISRVMSGATDQTRSRRTLGGPAYRRPFEKKPWLRLPSLESFNKLLIRAFYGLISLILAPFMMVRMVSCKLHNNCFYCCYHYLVVSLILF